MGEVLSRSSKWSNLKWAAYALKALRLGGALSKKPKEHAGRLIQPSLILKKGRWDGETARPWLGYRYGGVSEVKVLTVFLLV